MEAVVSVGKAALNGLLSGAKAAIAEDAALTQSVQRDVVFLTDELAAMRSYLRDADEEQNRHKVTRSRVKHVRDLAYDVEDCLEEHIVHLEKPSRWRLARTVLDRHRIAEEMKGLRARVEDSFQRNLRYRLAEDSTSSNPEASAGTGTGRPNIVSAGAKWQADLFLESPQVDLLPLIQKDDDQELRVIAVWDSTGESQKTSIIRRAYDSLKQSSKFQCYAWIRVVHPFNPSEFLQSIVRQFYVNSHQATGNTQEEAASLVGVQVHKKMMNNQDNFIDEFSEHVTQRSYLIVLNDLSTIEDWDWIKTYFPNNKKGSRIIVSAEQGELANLCAGPERLAVALKQSSFPDHTIYAFCEKDTSKDIPITHSERIDDDVKQSQFMREDEISKIIEKITVSNNDSQKCKVISICGKDGLGKTTLVKSIYHSEKLTVAKFNKRAYVTIKHPLKSNDLLESLAKQLGDKADKYRTKPIKQRLVDLLEGKKYLIVIDDLSSNEEWDIITNLLPKNNVAGWIIVTTSTESIAKYCSEDDENIQRLKTLEKLDARNLFMEKVFGRIIDFDTEHPELAKEADSILEKCNGFPLAINTIGGVLAAEQQKTLVTWRKLNHYIGAEQETNSNLGITRTILAKCYDCLPYDLKRCFLYLSIFPEDHIISRRRLVHRWTAEGYSNREHGKYKEIADSYFKELIGRNMIEPFLESIGHTKGIDSCRVNNLIHEMSTSKSVEENFVFRLVEGCGTNTHSKVRHLSVISDKWNGDRTEFENIVNPSTIRSLTVFGKWRSFFISQKMRMLRVLDLEGTSGLNDHHLKHIGKLLHLKYLSLRGCRDITHLPHSFGNLRQLEILDIKHAAIIMLPKAILRLRKLQYLRAGGLGAFGGMSYEESAQGMPLPELLRNRLCLLTLCSAVCCVACCAPQLRRSFWEPGGDPNKSDVCNAWCCLLFPFVAGRLDARGVVVPSGVNKLIALHTLATVNIGQGKVLQDIPRLTVLRKLGVVGLNKGNKEEFCKALSALSNLESLSVRSAREPGLAGCLESDALYSLAEQLKSLKLDGNLVKLPRWIDVLHNLVKLTLRWSRIEDHDNAMKILGELPKLAILRLLGKSFQSQNVRLTFHVNDQCQVFKSLKVLQLSRIDGLDLVEFKEGSIPTLELFLFSEGYRASTIFSGLSSLSGLKELRLEGGYTGGSLEGLLEELGKNPKKPILKRS